MAIRRYAQLHASRTAVVAGGGLLGLEAAFALHALGLPVVVLERGARLMSRQLDERASALVDAHFRRLGVTVRYRAESAALQLDDRVRAVRLTDGQVVPCDLYLAAIGIRPNLDLAVAAGISCRKGILVDDRMQTSAPAIFAAGDVAEHSGLVLGLWPIAAKQGEVAAVNALGGDQRLVAEIPATILKGVDLELSSIGQVEPGPGDEVIALDRPHSYRRLVISRGTLVGALVLGHRPKDLAAATRAVRTRQVLDAWALSELRAGRWDVLAAQSRMPGAVAIR
jgi:NAD(P)H-nitrite reductase large subunit